MFFFFNILRNNMNILYYDRTKFSERIDVNKTRASKECHKFQINFNIFHLYIFNECHDLVVMCISLNFTILNIWGVDYCLIINGIIKSDAIDLLANVYLSEKRVVF